MPNHTMKFHPAFHPLLRDGRKTQTRRVVTCDVTREELLKALAIENEHARHDAIYDIAWSYCPWRSGDTITVEGTDIRLTVTAIRCERLQGISDEDCEAEGVEYEPRYSIGGYYDAYRHPLDNGWAGADAADAFIDMWECFYPEGPKSWAANPTVWVVEFERLEKEDE